MRISKSTNINASTTDVLEPTVDNVLNLIENKKIIFKNDVAYWSRGKKVLPKEYRDCIEQTQYAHWINEWSCEQAEKFGDRAYYDYDGDTEVKATNMRITKATKTSVKASTQSSIIYDKNGIVVKKTGRNYDFIATIENNTDDVFCINTYDPSCDDVDECNVVVNPHDWIGILADDEGYAIVEYFEKLGGVMASKKLSTTDKALQHIKAAIDILGKSGNKDDVTKDSIANLATVMFDIKGSTIKSSSYKTEIGGIKVTVTPRYSMGYEDGYDVSGKHSDGSDAGHKYYNMRNLGGKYYNAKGFDKDRAMSDLAKKFIDDIGWDNKMKMD